MFWNKKQLVSVLENPKAIFNPISVDLFTRYFRENPIINRIITMYSKYLNTIKIQGTQMIYNWSEFLTFLTHELFITGNVFINTETLQIYNTVNVKILTSSNVLSGYKVTINNHTTLTFSTDEIIHIKFFNPGDLYGLTPMCAAQKSIVCYNEIENLVIGLLQNNGRPSGIITGVEIANHDKQTEIQNIVEDLFRGMKSNKGGCAVFSDSCKWQPISLDPEQLQLLKHKQQCIEEIAMAFDVPVYILGIMQSTYNNYQEAMLQFTKYSVFPLMKYIISKLNMAKNLNLKIEGEV